MVMQAWNQYGIIWPVIHQQLGVRPDLGRGRLELVPQVPPYEPSVTGENIRLGDGALRVVKATRDGRRYRTELDSGTAPVRDVSIGHTLPAGSRPTAVLLDGHRKHARVRITNRGVEVTVDTRPGVHVLEVITG